MVLEAVCRATPATKMLLVSLVPLGSSHTCHVTSTRPLESSYRLVPSESPWDHHSECQCVSSRLAAMRTPVLYSTEDLISTVPRGLQDFTYARASINSTESLTLSCAPRADRESLARVVPCWKGRNQGRSILPFYGDGERVSRSGKNFIRHSVRSSPTNLEKTSHSL